MRRPPRATLRQTERWWQPSLCEPPHEPGPRPGTSMRSGLGAAGLGVTKRGTQVWTGWPSKTVRNSPYRGKGLRGHLCLMREQLLPNLRVFVGRPNHWARCRSWSASGCQTLRLVRTVEHLKCLSPLMEVGHALVERLGWFSFARKKPGFKSPHLRYAKSLTKSGIFVSRIRARSLFSG